MSLAAQRVQPSWLETLRRASRRHWALLPLSLLLLVVFILPVLAVLLKSLEDAGPAANYTAAVTGVSGIILRQSVVVSAMVTVVSLVIALPFAHVVGRLAPRRLGAIMITAVVASLFVSIVVRGYAWLAILGREGLIDTVASQAGLDIVLAPGRVGVIIGMSQYSVPLMILPIYSAIVRYDPRLDLAAASLGASSLRTMLRVYLPLILPGVGAGCATVFTVTMGYYVLPSILGGPENMMIGTIIAQKAQRTLEISSASAISVILLVISLVSFIVIFRATRNDING